MNPTVNDLSPPPPPELAEGPFPSSFLSQPPVFPSANAAASSSPHARVANCFMIRSFRVFEMREEAGEKQAKTGLLQRAANRTCPALSGRGKANGPHADSAKSRV